MIQKKGVPLPLKNNGGLAQLASAFAWHAKGHGFESRILHFYKI